MAVLPAQTVPAGWTVVKDAKSLCQAAVPPDWSLLGESRGAAVLRDASTAIAAVTSQPGQAFQPLSASMQKILDIRKENVFENTARRVFYQDRISRNAETPSEYSASVPAKEGTCSLHVTFLPSVTAETARKIALSLGPVPE
jgi:hypothetical protein